MVASNFLVPSSGSMSSIVKFFASITGKDAHARSWRRDLLAELKAMHKR
jgi:hypothetical protein